MEPNGNALLPCLKVVDSAQFHIHSGPLDLGALTAFSFVNLLVLAKYVWRQGRWHSAGDVLRYIVTPMLGFCQPWAPCGCAAGRARLAQLWPYLGRHRPAVLGRITRGFRQATPHYHENLS